MSGVGDWVPAGFHLIFDQAIVFSLFVLLSLFLLFFFWNKDTIGSTVKPSLWYGHSNPVAQGQEPIFKKVLRPI